MSDKKAAFKAETILAVLKRHKDGEFKEDKDLHNVLEGIKLLATEQYGPFITGVNGDINGVPESIQVCYHYGTNYCGAYKLVHKGRTGQ